MSEAKSDTLRTDVMQEAFFRKPDDLEFVFFTRKLERENTALKSAIIATLNENAYLADGDDCTLKRLKDAVPEWRAE